MRYSQLGDYSINRAEAIAVLTDLRRICEEIASSELVEIKQSNGIELKIKCILDIQRRKAITDFLRERNLRMKEEEGYITIYQ